MPFLGRNPKTLLFLKRAFQCPYVPVLCGTVSVIVIAYTMCPTVFFGDEASESGVVGGIFVSTANEHFRNLLFLAILLVQFPQLVLLLFMSCFFCCCKNRSISSWIASWVSTFAAGLSGGDSSSFYLSVSVYCCTTASIWEFPVSTCARSCITSMLVWW